MSQALHIACPHCATTNRVPAARLAEHPNCGACKQPLFTGHPVALTTATFDRHLKADLPLVVEFLGALVRTVPRDRRRLSNRRRPGSNRPGGSRS